MYTETLIEQLIEVLLENHDSRERKVIYDALMPTILEFDMCDAHIEFCKMDDKFAQSARENGFDYTEFED